MNRKYGGGKPPTGTPSLAWSSVVVVASLLGGASIVHNIYKPNLQIPPTADVDEHKQEEGKKQEPLKKEEEEEEEGKKQEPLKKEEGKKQ